jgi:hypothetical protein
MRNAFSSENLKKLPLGRPVCRVENNIAVIREETGYKGVDWIHVAQDMDR